MVLNSRDTVCMGIIMEDAVFEGSRYRIDSWQVIKGRSRLGLNHYVRVEKWPCGILNIFLFKLEDKFNWYLYSQTQPSWSHQASLNSY